MRIAALNRICRLVWLPALLLTGCRCAEPPAGTAPAPAQAPAGGAGPSCAVAAGQYTLEPLENDVAGAGAAEQGAIALPRGGAAGSPEGNDEAPDQPTTPPFAVELGGIVSYPGGFAVAALRASRQGSTAVVALLPAGLAGATLVDLGRVHGDVATPRLAWSGQRLLAVVPEGDASGQSLRLAAIELSEGAPRVSWGASVHDGDDESQAFELAASAQHGVLLWDEWDKGKNHGVVKVTRFNSAEIGTLAPAAMLSAPDVDAESPRVVASGDGFWAAWAINDEPPAAAEPSAPPAASAQQEEDDEQSAERTLRALRRGVEVVRLDGNGMALGAARRVTPAGSQLTQYDIAPGEQGSLYVAWRSGASSLASEGGETGLLVVAADGNERRLDLAEIESGVGVPLLLSDSATPGGAWLAVSGMVDDTDLWAFSAQLMPVRVQLVEALREASPIGVRGEQLLWVRPAGRSLVFSVANCR